MKLTVQAARAAIEAIVAAIPDDELPQFERVEHGVDGKITVWNGGTGHTLGSATRNGQREPLVYRDRGSWHAIEAEMTYRADRRLFDNGDDPAAFKQGESR